MKKILVIVDMQNDFISGVLGTSEAVSIVDKVVEKISGDEWNYVYTTYDTHNENYLKTQEGKKLPIEHCQEDSYGWRLNEKIYDALVDNYHKYRWTAEKKNTFGSVSLAKRLFNICYNKETAPEDIELTLVGVCTDICVISNALLLKAYYPEMNIIIDASCCAGSTPEKHKMALEVMKSCQIDIINEYT